MMLISPSREPEFTDEQTQRIDEIENAVFDLCKVLTEKDDLEWNMEFIGEIADDAASLLAKLGYRIRYPAFFYNDMTVHDYPFDD